MGYLLSSKLSLKTLSPSSFVTIRKELLSFTSLLQSIYAIVSNSLVNCYLSRGFSLNNILDLLYEGVFLICFDFIYPKNYYVDFN